MSRIQHLPTLREIDEKHTILNRAFDSRDIGTMHYYKDFLLREENANYLKHITELAFGRADLGIFKYLMELCKPTTRLDINLMCDTFDLTNIKFNVPCLNGEEYKIEILNGQNGAKSNGHGKYSNGANEQPSKLSLDLKIILCGRVFVDALIEKRILLSMTIINMNGLARFVMLYYPGKVNKVKEATNLFYTVEAYREYAYFNMMFQGRITIIIKKCFWFIFMTHFDMNVDFSLFPVSSRLAGIFKKEPKHKQLGRLLYHLYCISRKKIPWTGNPLNRSEKICQYTITHKDLYTILPAVANCVLKQNNGFVYSLYTYIVSNLLYHKQMILEYMPIITTSHIFATKSSVLIKEWINNLKIWHSTLNHEECDKYSVVPFLHTNGWRKPLEDPYDSSCFTMDELKSYHKQTEEFKNGYPESYIFVCYVLAFLVNATSIKYDKLTDYCIDECLKVLPKLNLREVLHNTNVSYYVEKLTKHVKYVTMPMLRRAYLESRGKYKLLTKMQLLQSSIPKINWPFDYSQYMSEWVDFCKNQNNSIETHSAKIFQFIMEVNRITNEDQNPVGKIE